MNNLIGLQPVVDIVSLTLQSSFISNEQNGVSTILIAKPETAKTTTLFKFNGQKQVAYYDEITQKKLLDEFLPFVRNKQKRTLVIPDLINCTEKQRVTRDQFLNIIKTGTDDTGIVQVSTAFKILSPTEINGIITPLKFNILSATTYNSFKQIEKFFNDTGLASRMMFFSYDYPISMINKIMCASKGQKIESNIVYPKIITEDKEIYADPDLLNCFDLPASKIASRYGGFGIRAMTNLIRLAKSNAMINNRNKVNKSDVEKVLTLCNWINLDRNLIG